ncbi:flagellar biosynthesis protein FlhA [Clostridium estertheticum]|uniref:Flagellar biosynthesis protein FlhA n=1 Tax=Clostridium estertheticum TaxID=238834 RepID=A0AA47EJD3_9CLOT|nr:flagellar biosynthesis protein FlhA [Clostridium estertheticum]MBU3155101.1 flagellar biosynthesis protein FlhA [Clostridium estertheticum]MBU3198706.1 flagellar biosynthesis protein FlhA [Clostridium estertheticum]WAG61155.1 flagellar biosynthesis protein FlhA [Clostridium estertheticum]WAG64679.1 flagellar biosynthesis protein FlhA [Clostridium estertheticum]
MIFVAEKAKFKIKNNLDVLVAFGVIAIVLMIIIPLPPKLLDVIIAFNITLAVVILLLTMFTTEVLQFSVFPTLLLITTLLRLALNISSTRLVLTQAYAGDIIEAFGEFVVGGNYVVGIIIFLIIIIIQFVVITSGAGRVSEVSARFTLDAMPGKQMSIDADLNAGVITEEQARERRTKLQDEASFYGAMDGASKFVKGDAIAGIIITIINIFGGIIIGVVMLGMPIATAATTYVRLTVGDGLVSQIPALLISTASGILVTRSGSNVNLGTQITSQLTTFPKVIALASIVLVVLACIPGMPHIVFIILAIAMATSAYFLNKDEKDQKIIKSETEEQESFETENREPEDVMNLISVEPMEIEIGYGLIPLADEATGGDLLQRIASVRRQCALEMGIVVQPIRIKDNLQLKTNEYVVKIRGTVIIKGELMPSMLLCIDPSSEDITIQGINTVEPTFGLPAVWINNDQREDAEIKGLTVVDPTTVMVTHLTETIKNHAYELLGRQETKLLIDSVKEKYNTVVEELIPDLMTIGEVQKVLQSLLKEKVAIKDMVTILESLADNARITKDTEVLTEYVRFSLGRSICNGLIDENGIMTIMTLSPEVENIVSNNIQKSLQGSFPAVDPETTGKILNSIKENINTIYFHNNQPVILVSPKIRPAFRRLIEMVFPTVSVLSLNEIPNEVEIKTEGVVTLQ